MRKRPTGRTQPLSFSRSPLQLPYNPYPFTARRGRSTRVNQPTGGKASLNLADDAYAGSNEAHRPSRVTSNAVATSSMGFDKSRLRSKALATLPEPVRGSDSTISINEGTL